VGDGRVSDSKLIQQRYTWVLLMKILPVGISVHFDELSQHEARNLVSAVLLTIEDFVWLGHFKRNTIVRFLGYSEFKAVL